MDNRRILFFVVAATLGLALAAGCAVVSDKKGAQTLVATSEAFNLFRGEYENTAYMKDHPPRSVAVLPFADLQNKFYAISFDDENPAVIVRRGMYNHIASLPFGDLEMADTDARLYNAGLRDVRAIDKLIADDPQALRSILGVDAVVTGQVTHFDRVFAGIYSQVAVGCEVQMIDLATGNLLWRAKHVQRAHAGGVSLSPVGLIMAAIAATWNLRESELYSQTDDLFREMISTIYVPEGLLAAQTPKPAIDLFTVMNAGEPFTAGREVSFRLVGEENCRAYADLGDFKRGIELSPVSPAVRQALQDKVLQQIVRRAKETGHELTDDFKAALRAQLAQRQIYEGTYTVEPGEQAWGLVAKGYLINQAGGQAVRLDAVHTVNVDALAPDAPADPAASPLDGKVLLQWSAPQGEPLSSYQVQISDSPLGEYAANATVQTTRFVLEPLPNFTSVYVRVVAVDRAGNISAPTGALEATALPVPDLYQLDTPGPALGGNIARRILLTPQKSPYLVHSDLNVIGHGAIYAAPGVRLRFAPGTGLAAEGGSILLYGRPEAPVVLGGQSPDQPGSWSGVRLEEATTALLENVIITGAATGLAVRRSAPRIHQAAIVKSSQAGLHLGDGASLSLTCSRIAQNQGMGGLVIEGQGLAPIIRDNAFTGNTPFQVQSYTPLTIDLTGNYWGSATPEDDAFLGNLQLLPALDASPTGCMPSSLEVRK